MPISQHLNRDGPRTKRRKLSNASGDDDRFNNRPSSVSESHGDGCKDEQPVSKSQRSSNQPLRRPETQPVLPTGGLNKSSILAIQLDELIAESTPSYDTIISKLEQQLETLREIIQSTQPTGPLNLKQAERHASDRGVRVPFPSPRPSKETNLKFEYQTAMSIDVISRSHLKLGLKGPETVKLLVEMPKSCLQEKDYLDYRAFHKRAFYLACIAARIKEQNLEDFVPQYVHEDGIEILPSLLFTPKSSNHGKTTPKQQISIILTVTFPQNSFPIDKTLPNKQCVRPASSSAASATKPTPFYNSILNNQMAANHYYERLQKTVLQGPAFADACRVGQLWLKQRGFDSGIDKGGFGFWEWAIMSTLLLQTGGHKGHPLFSERYSSLQFFKAMLQVLASRDMTDPWILDASTFSIPKSDSPTFYDGNTGVNVLHMMQPWSYQTLRHHAQISISALNSKIEEGFDATFNEPVVEPLLQFDESYTITLPEPETESSSAQLSRAYHVFRRGLGDRVTLIDIRRSACSSWSMKKSQPGSRPAEVELGLILNMEAVARLIDHGPSADEPQEAEDFRAFWGEKSELRRFKDGTICESLVWSKSIPVTEQIIRWAAEKHFQIPEEAITGHAQRLEESILASSSLITANEAFQLIDKQLQTLSSMLHQLEGLTLPIRSISATDGALHSATLHHPLLPSTASPIPILIQFDSSTRWPDSLPAIQHTKIAFLLKLSDLLSASTTSITTRFGLENTSSQHSGYLNTSYLDIIYPPPHSQLSHITFRLRIHHDREPPLLQSQLTQSLAPQQRTLLTSSLTTHKRHLALPLHTTTLRTLTTHFPTLSPTIRLLLSFFASHHLSNLLPPQLLHLLCAHIFLHPAPYTTPTSPTTAFLRVLLFLSRWDWAVTPLIIDLSLTQDLPLSTGDDLKTRFQAWRKLDPLMNNVSWFVGTSIDHTGVVWSEGGRVEKVVAGRVRGLAGAVISLVTERSTEVSDGEWRGLFRGEMGEFDFVIKLQAELVRGGSTAAEKGSKGKEEGGKKFKNLMLAQQAPLQSIEEIGFDPIALYLEDLQRAFGQVALFFHGTEQEVICGLWRPSVVGEREWRVRLGWSSKPTGYKDVAEGGDGEEEGKVRKVRCEFNRKGALAEMGMLGEGIVREIEVK